MSTYNKSQITKPSRYPNRCSYDAEVVHAILDGALDITISYIAAGLPMAIPTGFVRIGDKLYIHGSVKSHFIQQICQNEKVCLTVSLLDGMVLANTAFNHSFNYRSVVVFSKPYEVHDRQVKMDVFKAFTDKILPGRWEDDIKLPSLEEMDITSLVCCPIEDASAKIRSGQANNSNQESARTAWTGYIPLTRNWQAPIASPDAEGMDVPEYIHDFCQVSV